MAEGFGSTLANELMDGLTVVIGQCEILSESLSDESVQHLNVIKAAALRMADRISRVNRNVTPDNDGDNVS